MLLYLIGNEAGEVIRERRTFNGTFEQALKEARKWLLERLDVGYAVVRDINGITTVGEPKDYNDELYLMLDLIDQEHRK